LALVNFLYGFFVLPESLPADRRRPFALKRANPLGTLLSFRGHRNILPLIVCAFFWQVAFQVYPSTWSYFAIAKFNLSSGAIGATLALSGISMAVVQGALTGRLVRRFGETRTAPLGIAWGALSFLGYALITERWMLFPILAIGGLQGIAMPSINALLSKQLGPERQGELQGGMASVMGLSSIVGPPVLTQALAHFSGPAAEVQFPGAAFVVASGFASLSLVLLVLALRRAGRESKALAAA
jgi:DHA1 family tetracycline resistance protein-like MFS transporter